ncbi:MAG: type II toxin-antitoxin system VapC family toxin [Caldilineales bacterium]|nr:type II toxin-antitoxin system VapC family toxin [Caldilineales bacterium]
MAYLLDTHVFLWWIEDNPKLPESIREIMIVPDNDLYLSAVSGWEIAIKVGIGKLELPTDPLSFVSEHLPKNAIRSLAVEMSHALHVSHLPPLHRDPFDRMLIVQSQLLKMPILTVDPLIAQYDIEVIG